MGKQFVAEFVEFGHRCRAHVNSCLDERALSSSLNGDVFSLKCWNDPIRLRNNRHWSFALTEGNRYELYRVHPKNYSYHFSGRLCGLRLLWSWFIRWSPLFWLFFRLGCEVMNSCFVHSNESTQKFIWITLKLHLKHYF